ncbi:MAG: class I SAM-dependent RNA methyltransferase [Rhodobacteraceae bacterium]|nr:class I SAM-dependent RNA methyltransferase [Paracoccaceae bacterium]
MPEPALSLSSETFEIFLICAPGLEAQLATEAREAGFSQPVTSPGGVTFRGTWQDVMQANLRLRGATRVLARIGQFRAFHLAQLDKRARKFPWSTLLRPDQAIKVEVTCRKSKIYHAGAATQRLERAIAEELGAPISAAADLVLKVRIDDNLVTLSLDTSGISLHKRGHKVAVNKAPMRETMAALFLRQAGYRGDEPVLDPMCGSGTFVIEAAEIAAGLAAGRSRGFSFERLANFDADAWSALKSESGDKTPECRFFGFDRDSGAIRMCHANAERAGVSNWTQFATQPISEARPPAAGPGLVILNPPYGGRIGNKSLLYGLYNSIGDVLKTHFSGWRVGIVTAEGGLARATGLPFKPPGPLVAHGGLKVRLSHTAPLP